MKKILYESKKNIFSKWLNHYFFNKKSKYIWPQICYDWDTGNLLHIVFEKTLENQNYINWPVQIGDIPVTNIDFTCSPPQLDYGKVWDYHKWHQQALNCELAQSPTTVPTSFWNWRLQTRPQGNATCDLDFMCKTVDGKYIGIEATEIYYVDQSSDRNTDVFEHFQRLFRLRKGKTGGFNLRQLKAQMDFVSLFDGRMFMLFHQILKDQNSYSLREDKCLLLELNEESYHGIEHIVNRSTDTENIMENLKKQIHFAPIQNIFDRFVE